MKYLALVRASILESLQFRLAMLMTVVGNLIYLLVIYYLWRAIFDSTDAKVINGMDFYDTMIYLVFASALLSFMEMWIVWSMGRDIQSGQIVVTLLKPMRLQSYVFFSCFGETIVKFFMTFLPTAIVVFIVTAGRIHVGLNMLFFVVSVILSILVNFYINFMVGTICMYTQSIWGINVVKGVLISVFSGAAIPIAFFPKMLGKIVMFLPFQAICNTPLTLLLKADMSMTGRLQMLGLQVFWVGILLLLCNAFFRISLKRITVNGG